MSTQRYISTSFWDDEWVHKLDPSEKLMYMYFLTNPLTNIAGVYKLTENRICYDTGFNENTIRHIMEKFEKAGKAFRKGEYIALPSWPRHQKWQTKDSIKAGIISILNDLDFEVVQWLVLMGYKFDMSLTHHPPIIHPSSPHQPTYSDSDSDSNYDSDTDSNTPEIPAIPPKQKNLCSSEAYILADLLSSLHTQNIDKGYKTITPNQNQRWAGDIEKLNRLDGRSFQDIEKAIRWIKTPGQFWAPNIMSGAKLREKFPTIWAQMSQRPGYSKPELKVNQRTTMLDLEE